MNLPLADETIVDRQLCQFISEVIMSDHNIFDSSSESNQVSLFIHQNESVEDLLYEFLKNRTPLTERSYRIDLKHFFNYTSKTFGVPKLEKNGCFFRDVKRVHIVKYKNFLDTHNSKRGIPYAPNTINRKISAISSFFQFLLRREIIDKNPAEFCVRPRREILHETQAFTDREMKNFLNLVISEASALHKAVILVLFTTGMRQAELRGLKLKDIIKIEGIHFLTYMGKGSKINQVPLHPTTSHYIDEYLSWMSTTERVVKADDYIFQPTKNSFNGVIKKKLSHTAVGYIVNKWALKITKEKRITPHSARATFISSLIDNGEDIYYVSQLVNHADVRTTQKYNKRSRNFRRNPIFNLNFF
jgi:site-specific recombinase XerD